MDALIRIVPNLERILNDEQRLAIVGCCTVAIKDITAKDLIDTRSRM